MKLFAFPFAGASSMYYYKWKKHLGGFIDLVPVELAGRGTRQKTAPYQTFAEAVEDVYEQIYLDIEKGPFAFFGHSMGCLLAYELCYKLKEQSRREPSVMFLSGRWPPHVLRADLVDPRTSDELLKTRLLELGGATPELFENKNLADIFIPILRSDFLLMESYEFVHGRHPLSAEFQVMTGVNDWDVNQPDLIEWRNHTNGEFTLHKFKGGHFYINDSFEIVIRHINCVLESLAKREPIRNANGI